MLLSGEAEVEIRDGTRRRYGLGDIMLMEDLSGQGHITRHFGDYVVAIVPLA